MSSYIVSPESDQGISLISAQTLARKIRETWPQAQLREASGAFVVEWMRPTTAGRLSGRLFAHGQGIALEGDPASVAETAVWFRSLVSDEYPLFLYDQGYSVSVNLHGATVQTVARALR